VILVPDLDSYTLINPRLLPGLDEEVQINNWEIESSVFSFRTPVYNTDLGIIARAERTPSPELYFTINSQRNFLGPFIAYLLPGVVAAGMLFAFLLSDRRPGDREEIVSALNYAAALFFVIVVTHAALRERIAAVELTYMEYLYVLLYVAIVAVAVNTFLVVNRPDLRLLQYRNNLIPKLLYWPAFIGVLLLVTLLVFVY
jgi:hypothetical protein